MEGWKRHRNRHQVEALWGGDDNELTLTFHQKVQPTWVCSTALASYLPPWSWLKMLVVWNENKKIRWWRHRSKLTNRVVWSLPLCWNSFEDDNSLSSPLMKSTRTCIRWVWGFHVEKKEEIFAVLTIVIKVVSVQRHQRGVSNVIAWIISAHSPNTLAIKILSSSLHS